MHRRERFKVTLDIRADGCPAVVTLKRLLKVALRAFGVRCIGVEQLPEEKTDSQRADVRGHTISGKKQ